VTGRVGELLRADVTGEWAIARRDAEVLLGHCLGRGRAWLYAHPEAQVPAPVLRRFMALRRQRAAGVPVAYLTGEREFWSLSLEVDRHTLIPRPETELLVEWALALGPRGACSVLDLGTGSGAIAVALAVARPDWEVTGVDASADALAVARRNAGRYCPGRVRLLCSDWFSALGEGALFDLIVANPPYVEPDSRYLEHGDVRFEPRTALAAPENGLGCLRAIISTAPRHLGPGAWLALEHGSGQGAAVRDLLRRRGYGEVATRADLAGLERATVGRHRGAGAVIGRDGAHTGIERG